MNKEQLKIQVERSCPPKKERGPIGDALLKVVKSK